MAKLTYAQRKKLPSSTFVEPGARTPYEKVKAWRESLAPQILKEKRREEARKRREKHGEKIREYQASWRKENIELHRAADAARQRKNRRINKEAQAQRMARFRLKQEAVLISLAGRPRANNCELCGDSAKTVFDHCHANGHFRGWLCDRCNRTLGQVKDNQDLLLKMVEYLKKGGIGYGETNGSRAEENPNKIICIAG